MMETINLFVSDPTPKVIKSRYGSDPASSPSITPSFFPSSDIHYSILALNRACRYQRKRYTFIVYMELYCHGLIRGIDS